ncbi:hypothetical protein [Flavobacterium phage FPSV-S1]|nr:hypothetical protein [Flavobacterium phage FPSV-S1]QCW20493.1 hypothetical protein [Flavobacterium phage FPSV-S8]QCW20656.1 hypothetical protein [Flavobacterium phage FPSV-S27]
MAKKSIAILKQYYLTGLRPTQQNYHDWLDSFLHKDDGVLITSIVSDPLIGNVTINYTSGDPFIFNVTPTSVPISAVTGLQDVLNNFVLQQNGYGLTQNNFTNEDVILLNELGTYLDYLQNYNGGLSVKNIFIPSNLVLDSAGADIEGFLSEIEPSFSINRGQLLTVKYNRAELSDGSSALVHCNAVFALPAGKYGFGFGDVYGSTVFDSYEFKLRDSAVVLEDEYSIFGLNAVDIQGNLLTTSVQEQFNQAAYKNITSIYGKPAALRGRDFTNGYSAQWNDNTPMSWINDEIYRISTNVNFSQLQDGFSVICQIENQDPITPSIMRRFYLALNKAQGSCVFSCWLEEVQSNTYLKRKKFETDATNIPENFFKIDVEVIINDLAANNFNCLFNIDGASFSLTQGNVTFTDYSGGYGTTNYPQNNRICWGNYYPAKILMSSFYYQINGIERNFSLDQPYIPYATTDGVFMNISPNNDNFWDLSKTSSLYVKPSSDVIRALDFNDIHALNNTEVFDLSMYMSPNWRGKVFGQMNNGNLRVFITGSYKGDKTDLNTYILLDKIPEFLFNRDYQTSKCLYLQNIKRPTDTILGAAVMGIENNLKIKVNNFDINGFEIKETLVTFDLLN